VLAAVVLWELGERWWPATVFLFGPRWLLLLPLAVLLPAAALLRPRMLAPLLAAAVVVLGPVLGLRVHWRQWGSESADAPGLRVVTLNADGGERVVGQLPRLLAELQPDVLVLQECAGVLADAVGRAPGWFHHADQELCLLSRYPITRAVMMDRSSLEEVSADGFGGSGFVITYTLAAPFGPVSLTNLHLETPRKGFDFLRRLDPDGLGSNTLLREIESHRARQWVDRAGAAALVAGDFNLPVESSIFREAWGDFGDAFSEAGMGFGMTKYNGWVRARIDHVLLGRGWRAVRASVGPDVGSDHRPVVADLRWVGGG
jgi:endonuclease/exonuclease/phosphatase (EEP) superfamily protein YafD